MCIRDSDYGEQCRFDAFCKKVLRNAARAYLRNMKRQREREAFFSDLSQADLDLSLIHI